MNNYLCLILLVAGNPGGKTPLGELGVDGRIILKRTLRGKMHVWAGLILLRLDTDGVIFAYGYEHSGFIKGQEFLDQLREC